MSDNRDTILEHLRTLNLTTDETEVYLQLLPNMSTYLQLSRGTGITRSKVYKIVDGLIAKSLVSRYSDDRGAFLKAAEPSSLEIEVIAREARTLRQRQALNHVVPLLNSMVDTETRQFIIRSYEGQQGFKQMCWHELTTKGELLVLGYGVLENLIQNRGWSEEHRRRTIDAKYSIKAIINDTDDLNVSFASNTEFMKRYSCRTIPSRLLPLRTHTVIYNDTVAIYHMEGGQRTGIEIISAAYAESMRAIFYHYWDVAHNWDTPATD